MAPPSAPGPSDWEVYEPSSDTGDHPPPYTEYPTVPVSQRQNLDSRPGGSHTCNSGFTDAPEYDPVEPAETRTSEEERRLFTHVFPYVIEFLNGIKGRCVSKSQGSSSFRADLYLVPEGAIPAAEDWQLSGADYLKQSCDHLDLCRVTNPNSSEKQSQKGKGVSNGSRATDELSELPGDLWWKKEDHARGLVEYLDRQLQGSPVKAAVRAEEMTFRRESDMGLWESKSGWTIIISATSGFWVLQG